MMSRPAVFTMILCRPAKCKLPVGTRCIGLYKVDNQVRRQSDFLTFFPEGIVLLRNFNFMLLKIRNS